MGGLELSLLIGIALVVAIVFAVAPWKPVRPRAAVYVGYSNRTYSVGEFAWRDGKMFRVTKVQSGYSSAGFYETEHHHLWGVEIADFDR